VSVVFPMYNEEAYIERAVAAVHDALSGAVPDYEIVIVDDASTDRTPELADALAAGDARVRVVHNPTNRQLGGALRAGYAAAGKDLVCYTDADLPIDLHELPRAIRLLEYQAADVVAAYRFDRTSEGPVRAMYTFFYNHLIRVLFGLRVRDVNFAFKLFRRAVLQRFTLKSEGSFIDAEFLLRARKAGCPIIQVGLDYFPRTRGRSTLATVPVIGHILWEMARSWRELR
jgi:glycosyltransferase involved in cell wall biosynthesis